MRSLVILALLGATLVSAAVALGGWAAGIGGAVAVLAQGAAVAVLRPAMGAGQDVFMARWLAGMAIRAAAVLGVVLYAATHRARLDPLAASTGCLGVLLPLLFLETRFLR